MKFLFLSLAKRFGKSEKKILGRWNIESCDKKMNSKIDLSNEDHCGPCGQYILNTRATMLEKSNEYKDKK